MKHDAIFVEQLSLGGDGLRVAVKDCIDIAGFATQGGSRALRDQALAKAHADVVARLIEAGCHIVGKANMHELAYGVTGVNHWTGTPPNPHFPDLVPGGSSSGSAAAVAAGLVDFAVGSDTGGSIRTPAACCGVVGFKPSFGRVSRLGAYPVATTLDCVGPLAGDVAMIEQAMEIIDPTFEAVPIPQTLRLGLVSVDADEAVAAAFAAVVDQLPYQCVPVVLPSLDAAFGANMAVIAAETWTAFGHLIASDGLGDDIRARLMKASQVGPDDLAEAERVRSEFRAEVDRAFDHCDVLLLPTMPGRPLRLSEVGDAALALRMTLYVRPFNLSGHPALSMPMLAAEGFPIGVQLVGRQGEDAALCAAARLVESHLSTLKPLENQEQTV